MLKVTVKNEKVIDNHWKNGAIRMTQNRDIVIMIVKSSRDEYTELRSGYVEFIYLDSNPELLGRVFSNSKNSISHDFPIVVENAELIIGGN